MLSYSKKQRQDRKLRYCPECYRDDIKNYGEPYLRTEHQIALLPLCPKHRCRLIELARKQSMPIGQQIITLPEEPAEMSYRATEAEQNLTSMIHFLYALPFEKSPNIKTENLQTAVENAGMLIPDSVKQRAWDTEHIYSALVETFGSELTTEYFGKHITAAHALRLRKYEIFATEEYAMLSVMLKLPPDSLFTTKRIQNHIAERMRTAAQSGRVYTKAAAARAIGVREDQLLPYAKRFGIDPCWIQSGKARKPNERKTFTIAITVSEDEKKALDRYMREHDFDAYSHVLHLFMRRGLAES